MTDGHEVHDHFLVALKERAKELNCIYEVDTLLNQPDESTGSVYKDVVRVMGRGWQYPDICEACIEIEGKSYKSRDFKETEWCLGSDIMVQGETIGRLTVYYLEDRPDVDVGPFIKEEVRLIKTLADRLAYHVLRQRLESMRQSWNAAREDAKSAAPEWRVALDMILHSDKTLYLRVSRKMLNHLCSLGIQEAQGLLSTGDPGSINPDDFEFGDSNIPGTRHALDESVLLDGQPFEVASEHLGPDEILRKLRWWLQEDKISFLIKVLGSPHSTMQEITDALRRYYHLISDEFVAPESTVMSLRVSLAERFLSDQLHLTKIAKKYSRISTFRELADRFIMPARSHGKIGGKGAGLLMASWIYEDARTTDPTLTKIKTPKTWFVASDAIMSFIVFNDLEDVFEQKYKSIDTVRREYPNLVQLFKHSPFPQELMNGLAAALDDFGDKPLVVRSSSLLEDNQGSSFSGKYKSLFLANQGSKSERLDALTDAIAEIYASGFAPDPIEYRRELGLLEYHEQMGVLIQEVVGTRVGKYYLPAFAGVALSRNEFRWSPRIEREDGLIRIVPGLGTRAVDRTRDDYPVLIVPKKPDLHVNVEVDEIIRYAPKKVDVINLAENSLETINVDALMREYGQEYPALTKVFSVISGDRLEQPSPVFLDPNNDTLVPTFRGLRKDPVFNKIIDDLLSILEESLQTPVDLEFAHDGSDFYLLQCRPQSSSDEESPVAIPRDIPSEDILFTANRYVSNGWVPDITHLVYVDPDAYAELSSRSELLSVGTTIGKLNQTLPKKQFILMGPGRWGSRGDVKLGVSVTYADINNTAMLVEIARQKGGYLPDLSFGTHFFQDLVEARIRYLPLYPDEQGAVFNEQFLNSSPNLLPDLVPDCGPLSETIKVIEIPASAGGRVLRVLMNADLEEAVAVFADPGESLEPRTQSETRSGRQVPQYWRWRLEMAEKIAAATDPDSQGVAAMYIFGSVKNGTAGPGSDIDLLVHFQGNEEQLCNLNNWLEGWSQCLAEMNYLKTGYATEGLLDVHIVTDEDIENGKSFATKIGAVTDAARPLAMG
ncbi:MAG: pyruvate, phosphate dikinase [Verrucomicrobia bacterium]|nr:MAG: pyruvate, phosphate dikinase [Verrucomicrobiota bacterium]